VLSNTPAVSIHAPFLAGWNTIEIAPQGAVKRKLMWIFQI
jgi:hypothetical protein